MSRPCWRRGSSCSGAVTAVVLLGELWGELKEGRETKSYGWVAGVNVWFQSARRKVSPQEGTVIPRTQWTVVLVPPQRLKSRIRTRPSASAQGTCNVFCHPSPVIPQLESMMKTKFGSSHRMCCCYGSKAAGLLPNAAPRFDLFFPLIERGG